MNRFVFAGSVVISALGLGTACAKVGETPAVTTTTDAATGDSTTDVGGPLLGESAVHYLGGFYTVIRASGVTQPLGTANIWAFDVTADGSKLAVVGTLEPSRPPGLYWVDPATDTRRLLATVGHDETFYEPRFSPDGRHVACRRSSIEGLAELGTLIASVDGTSTRSTERFLSWAPDGKNLLVIGRTGYGATVIAPDGSVVLSASSLGNGRSTTSAGWLDPTRVLYGAILDTGGPEGGPAGWLGRVGIDGAGNTLLRAQGLQGEFQMSPDGRWVLNRTFELFASDGSGIGLPLDIPAEVHVRRPVCTFSPDSTKIACLRFETSVDMGVLTVRRVTAPGVTTMSLPRVSTFGWAPTSDALAVATAGDSFSVPGDAKVNVPSAIALVSLEASPRPTVLMATGVGVNGWAQILWRAR